jgi:hypothetical protein
MKKFLIKLIYKCIELIERIEYRNHILDEDDNDYKILSEKISELVLNKEMRIKMGKESLAIFNEDFQIEKVHSNMFQLLKSMVN